MTRIQKNPVYIDLLKAKNVIGELLLQPPFLVHHVGTERGVTVGSSLSAPVPPGAFPLRQVQICLLDVTLLKKMGSGAMNALSNQS